MILIGAGRGSLRPNNVAFPYTAVITKVVSEMEGVPTTVEIAYLRDKLPKGVVEGEREQVNVRTIRPVIKNEVPVFLKEDEVPTDPIGKAKGKNIETIKII